MLLERYLASDDYDLESSRRLVAWCRRHGADEFTIACIGTDPKVDEQVWRPFETIVQPYAVGTKVRRRMSGSTAEDLVRPTDLWALNDTTVTALAWALPDGVLDYRVGDYGWFEDPILYREGEVMLGVVTHESSAVLRLTDVEAAKFSAAGFLSHDALPWISY
jgi:hypothetical protein